MVPMVKPNSSNTHKTPVYTDFFRKVFTNFFLVPSDTSQDPTEIVQTNFFVPARLQKLVGEIFSIFCREILQDILQELGGIFSNPQNKGSKHSEKNGAFFATNFVAQKEGFVQTLLCRRVHWQRGSTGAERYGCIPQSAANNLGEIPQEMGAPNP